MAAALLVLIVGFGFRQLRGSGAAPTSEAHAAEAEGPTPSDGQPGHVTPAWTLPRSAPAQRPVPLPENVAAVRYRSLYHGLSRALPVTAKPGDLLQGHRYDSGPVMPRLVAQAGTGRAIRGEDVVVQAELITDGKPVTVRSADIFIFDEHHAAEGVRAAMTVGESGGRPHFDHRQLMSEPLVKMAPEPDGTIKPGVLDYLVYVTGDMGGVPFVRRVMGAFQVFAPGGHVDGQRVSAARSGQDLVVEVNAFVARPGRYFVSAELWPARRETSPSAPRASCPSS